MKFGAIDIGTNAARLLVGEVCQEQNHFYVKKISYTRIPLRLGEDVFELGRISKAKYKNTVDTIKSFKLIAGIFEVEQLRAVATSAMRESKNAEKIIQKITQKTVVTIEVISGQEEADLIFGTFLLLDFDKSMPFIVVDVGGGSTEISVFEQGQKIASKSFEIGTIRMLKNKVSEEIWEEMAHWLDKNMDKTIPHSLFGTGGNINKIHKIIGLKDQQPVEFKKMKSLYDSIRKLSVEERMDKFHLKPDRADVIVPALEIYLFLMSKMQINKILAPKIGLSDGMIYKMFTDSINLNSN
jgi:exopolyphosphatase/guanosine-5'-triphosphate,3'-diphosphate pyrophosphatase